MLRPALIAIAALAGMGILASITGLRNLWALKSRGIVFDGEVLSADPRPRGNATIRILIDSRPVEISEPCFGFSCVPGAHVPVTALPGDYSVRTAGDLNEQFRTALIASFLVGPLFLGGGVAYSLWRMAHPPKWYSPDYRKQLRYLPILMSFGTAISTLATFALGGSPPWSQRGASASLVVGSCFYWAALRRRSVALLWIPTVLFFGLGTTLLILALTR